MVQSDQSTSAIEASWRVPEGLGTFDSDSKRQFRTQNVDQAINNWLAKESDGRTIRVSDSSSEIAARPTFARQSQINHRFSLGVEIPSSAQWRVSTFHALQEWEGYVLSVRDTDFVARLVDITGGSANAAEEADIPLAEISENDLTKLRRGSIFRWVIGYERSISGSKKRVSEIVFRDTPAMNETDMQKAEAWALEAIRLLKL